MSLKSLLPIDAFLNKSFWQPEQHKTIFWQMASYFSKYFPVLVLQFKIVSKQQHFPFLESTPILPVLPPHLVHSQK